MANNDSRVTTYKGFDRNWQCRGFQFAVGKTYLHEGEVEACASGFHSCEYPLDVFSCYPPASSVFAVVEASGVVSRHDKDSKIASSSLTVKASISLPGLVSAAVEFITARLDRTQELATSTGYLSVATSTGNRSAATNTGDQSVATNTGDQSVATNTGYLSVATNTGDQSVATSTGDRSVATSTGNRSAATNTGHRSAATNTGDQSVATNTGDRSAATSTGNRSAATNTGRHGVAAAFGLASKALAGETGTLIVAWWDWVAQRKRFKVGYVGEDGIKANTYYRVNDYGKFEEVPE